MSIEQDLQNDRRLVEESVGLAARSKQFLKNVLNTGILTAATNLGKTIVDTAEHVAHGGNALTSAAIALDRWRLCENCEHIDRLTSQCHLCSCYMPGKVHVSQAYCPKGLWMPVTMS